MNDQEKIHREVVIANRTYPLKIHKNDEEKILNIVQTVNRRIEHLKSIYDAKDNQDYLAMCLLQLYTQQNTQNENSNIDLAFEKQISNIEQLLEPVEYIKVQ
jgi:cell division protein ZapA (FtsZ GTPase activity inhibitor)